MRTLALPYLWFAALLAVVCTAGMAAPPNGVTVIERAQFVAGGGERPPGADAPWKPVALPDSWRLTRPFYSGQVWYRLHFHIEPGPFRTHMLYVPRNSATEMAFIVNGLPLAKNFPYGDPRLSELQRPLAFTVPPAMLRYGENVLHVRVTGHADYRHGLSRVTIGPGPVVRPAHYEPRYDRQVTSIVVFGGALLFAALLALFLWRGERQEATFFWYAMTALTGTLHAYLLLWPPPLQDESLRQLLNFFVRHLYMTPLLVLCLRVGSTRAPRLEAVLWLGFAAGCVAAMLMPGRVYSAYATAVSLVYFALGLGFVAWLIRARFEPRQWTYHLLLLALLMAIALAVHDWARWMGYIDFDSLLLAPFAAPFLVLGLGATVIQRHLNVVRALARANAELEQRIAAKAREIEQTYRTVQEAHREQAVLQERQRIMADMHDSLGASLVSLISRVQSRSANLQEIENRLDDTLMELRAIVDSLEPVEGDLGVVLGNIRYRMRAAIEDSGAKLVWRVQPLPILDNLTPDRILAVQRIVLEALTNSLRHAGAHAITVSTGVTDNRSAIIVAIADDGAGFEPSPGNGGRGLRNMRNRAATIGASIEIRSSCGGGTQVILEIPFGESASQCAMDSARSAPEQQVSVASPHDEPVGAVHVRIGLAPTGARMAMPAQTTGR